MKRKTAMITGASSGIGESVARALAACGHNIVALARGESALARLAKSLEEHDVDVQTLTCDVRDPASVTNAVDASVDAFGGIDILVNSAGRGGGGVTAELDHLVWQDVLSTNLTGTFLMTKHVLAHGGMRERGWGRVVNVASTGGKQGVVLAAPYSASKHGVVGFTKAVGLELAKTGITVNAVCPGYVETPMAQGVRERYAAHWGISEQDVLERFNAKIPLGRYSTPDEVAGLVTYLTTDTAASITAQALNVCGGLGNY